MNRLLVLLLSAFAVSSAIAVAPDCLVGADGDYALRNGERCVMNNVLGNVRTRCWVGGTDQSKASDGVLSVSMVDVGTGRYDTYAPEVEALASGRQSSVGCLLMNGDPDNPNFASAKMYWKFTVS